LARELYAFAPILASLAKHARLLAIDLPGLGASERRQDLLSPLATGGFLAQLITDVDLGTASHRRAGRGDRSRFVPCGASERIASVIVGTGGDPDFVPVLGYADDAIIDERPAVWSAAVTVVHR
jgi:pimeloyl-ACP methyl ester carboxylesterase